MSLSSSKIVQTLLEKSYKYNCELSEEEKPNIKKLFRKYLIIKIH